MDPSSSVSLSPSEQQLPKRLYYAFDVETTGGNLANDLCFAVGWAYGFDASSIQKGGASFNMKEDVSLDWKTFWTNKGLETRCYDEFWSKNLDVLNRLQDKDQMCLKDTSLELAEAVNDVLTKLETLSEGKLTLVTNTTSFDTVWLSNLLSSIGKPDLGYRRDGSYNGKTVHTGSFRSGVYKVGPNDASRPWDEDEAYKAIVFPDHDHDPKNDAHQILTIFFASLDKLERDKAEEHLRKTTTQQNL